jgi:hypothetical protein
MASQTACKVQSARSSYRRQKYNALDDITVCVWKSLALALWALAQFDHGLLSVFMFLSGTSGTTALSTGGWGWHLVRVENGVIALLLWRDRLHHPVA